VEESEVPNGPWRDYGKNNPFSLDAEKVGAMPSYTAAKVQGSASGARARVTTTVDASTESARLEELRRQRDLWFSQNGGSSRSR
jgi:hypothetical protein